MAFKRLKIAASVVDPDSDPYVFGPTGSFFSATSKKGKETLLLFCDFFDYLSLKTDVNVP